MVKGITYILSNDDNVQSLVGRNAANTKYKAYPNVCAQPEKFPYSVVRQTGKEPIECKNSIPTTYIYRYDVFSFHNSYDDCEALDDAVVEALIQKDGSNSNGVVFQEIMHKNTVDQYNSEYQLHVKISSFEAMVNEDQAT